MKKLLFAIVLLVLLSKSSFTQEGVLKTVFNKDGVITFRALDTKILKNEATKSSELIKSLVHSDINDELILQNSLSDKFGYNHQFYLQFYKGVRVQDAMYISHTKNGLVESVNGDFLKVGDVDINALLTEDHALLIALEEIGAKIYKWQIKTEEQFIKNYYKDERATYFPKGELVIVYSDYYKSYRLAYKFNIFA